MQVILDYLNSYKCCCCFPGISKITACVIHATSLIFLSDPLSVTKVSRNRSSDCLPYFRASGKCHGLRLCLRRSLWFIPLPAIWVHVYPAGSHLAFFRQYEAVWSQLLLVCDWHCFYHSKGTPLHVLLLCQSTHTPNTTQLSETRSSVRQVAIKLTITMQLYTLVHYFILP